MKFEFESQRFTIEVDGRDYRLHRSRTNYNNWKWDWTVHGGTMMHSRWCDPDGRTFKKVVAAAEQWISENPNFAEVTP